MKYNMRHERWEEYRNPQVDFEERWIWCLNTFGYPVVDSETSRPTIWKWHGGWIYIYDKQYVALYLLRWS